MVVDVECRNGKTVTALWEMYNSIFDLLRLDGDLIEHKKVEYADNISKAKDLARVYRKEIYTFYEGMDGYEDRNRAMKFIDVTVPEQIAEAESKFLSKEEELKFKIRHKYNSLFDKYSHQGNLSMLGNVEHGYDIDKLEQGDLYRMSIIKFRKNYTTKYSLWFDCNVILPQALLCIQWGMFLYLHDALNFYVAETLFEKMNVVDTKGMLMDAISNDTYKEVYKMYRKYLKTHKNLKGKLHSSFMI